MAMMVQGRVRSRGMEISYAPSVMIDQSQDSADNQEAQIANAHSTVWWRMQAALARILEFFSFWNSPPDQAPLPAERPQWAYAQVAVAVRPYIILARPLNELGAHIWNLELPSCELVARSIKTLALAIFRWHFCDRVLLPQEDGIYHSMNGRVEHLPREELDARYPHLFRKALKLEPIANCLPVHHDQEPASIENYLEISAQTIYEHFLRIYNEPITNREEGNSITDLAWSRHLREVRNLR